MALIPHTAIQYDGFTRGPEWFSPYINYEKMYFKY